MPERTGLDPVHTRDVAYGYDLRGLQLFARFDSEADEGVSNSYDSLGRLTTSVSTMGGAMRTLSYAYDGANQLTGIIDEGNAIGIVGFYYDSRLRLYFQSEVFEGGAGDVQRNHSYNPASQMISRTLSNEAYAFTGEVNAARGYIVDGLNQYVSDAGLLLTGFAWLLSCRRPAEGD